MVLIYISLPDWIAGWHVFEEGPLPECIHDVPECFPEKPWAYIHVSCRTSFSSGVTNADRHLSLHPLQ